MYYVLKQNRCCCRCKKFCAEIQLDKIVEEKLIKVYETPAWAQDVIHNVLEAGGV